MDHNISLITTLAAGFGMALVFGYLAERLRLPALVGYLVAGILIGPATPGFVADVAIASQLAEIGVMLLMFGVGLHFSVSDLFAVKRIALPGALVQMLCATALGMAVALGWGWSWGQGLVFGLTLSCASTVVLLKALEARGLMANINGRIAIGWLVVEDLATVLVLVLLPPLAGVLGGQAATVEGAATPALWRVIATTLLEITAFIGLMLVAGRKLIPWLLWKIAGTGSRELFTLSVVTAAISVAFGAAQLFGVSFALGAFVAGMVMRESEFSHRAAHESLPLRDAFSVLFFVSVGMLFQPAILIEQPGAVMIVVAIIMLGKALAAGAIVLALRYPLDTALTVAASLAQIGEFSFVLAGLGQALGLLPQAGMSLVLAGALVSITLNPLMFSIIPGLLRRAQRSSGVLRTWESRRDPCAELPMTTERRWLEKQVVLVGYGSLGERIADTLRTRNIPFVVADHNRETVERLRLAGTPAVCGNANLPDTLIQAHIANAAVLVVVAADAIDLRQVIDTARQLNPRIAVIVRANSAEEATLLESQAGCRAFVADQELAINMADHVARTAAPGGADQIS